MARIRDIKQDLYLDEEFNAAAVSFAARYIFPGLWTIADREGRLEDRPAKIKAQLLPYDNEDMDDLLRQLASVRAIIRYELDGKRYIQIRTFLKHQRPHPKEAPSSTPAPTPEQLNFTERNLISRKEIKRLERGEGLPGGMGIGIGNMGNGNSSSTRPRGGDVPATPEAADLETFSQEIITSFADYFPGDPIGIHDATKLADGFLTQCKDNPRKVFTSFMCRLAVTPNAKTKPVGYALRVMENENLLSFSTKDPPRALAPRTGIRPLNAMDLEPKWDEYDIGGGNA